jgi:hypothetical protein
LSDKKRSFLLFNSCALFSRTNICPDLFSCKSNYVTDGSGLPSQQSLCKLSAFDGIVSNRLSFTNFFFQIKCSSGLNIKKRAIADAEINSKKFTARLGAVAKVMWPGSLHLMSLDPKKATSSQYLITDNNVDDLTGKSGILFSRRLIPHLAY